MIKKALALLFSFSQCIFQYPTTITCHVVLTTLYIDMCVCVPVCVFASCLFVCACMCVCACVSWSLSLVCLCVSLSQYLYLSICVCAHVCVCTQKPEDSVSPHLPPRMKLAGLCSPLSTCVVDPQASKASLVSTFYLTVATLDYRHPLLCSALHRFWKPKLMFVFTQTEKFH